MAVFICYEPVLPGYVNEVEPESEHAIQLGVTKITQPLSAPAELLS